MSERKVLNKYYAPDFDSRKLPKVKRDANRQFHVRIMAPCNMVCDTCGEYIYKGKKFNSRQETAEGELYLGLRIFRFYIKCTRCMSEITFKTNLQTMDYELENGATRNFQAQRAAEQQAEREADDLEAEKLDNPMLALEARTQESRYEMERLEALEELHDISQRQASISQEELLKLNSAAAIASSKRQEEEDEAFVKRLFGKKSDDGGFRVKRILDDDDADEEEASSTKSLRLNDATAKIEDPKMPSVWTRSIGSLSSENPIRALVTAAAPAKPIASTSIAALVKQSPGKTTPKSAAFSALGAYGGDSSSDSNDDG